MRIARGLLVVAVASLVVAVLAPVSANAAVSLNFSFRAPVKNTDYVFVGAGNSISFSVALVRNSGNANHTSQTHSWSFQNSGGEGDPAEFSCRNDLSLCTLATHDA